MLRMRKHLSFPPQPADAVVVVKIIKDATMLMHLPAQNKIRIACKTKSEMYSTELMMMMLLEAMLLVTKCQERQYHGHHWSTTPDHGLSPGQRVSTICNMSPLHHQLTSLSSLCVCHQQHHHLHSPPDTHTADNNIVTSVGHNNSSSS